MKPNMPQDELLQRYAEAKAELPDGLPDTTPAALRERILKAAKEQADAMNTIASRAESMPANGLKDVEKQVEKQIFTAAAANDSIWNIRALGSLAVMGLAGLLWWQFEHGTPEEREAAQSAKPNATVAAAAPDSTSASGAAPMAPPAVAPASAPAIQPAASAVKAAESIAPRATQAPAKSAQAKAASPSSSKETAEQATPLPVPVPAPVSTPAASAASSSALETARARAPEANPNVAPAPAQAQQIPPPPASPRPAATAAAAAPMAKSAPQAEKATIDSTASGIQYAAPANSQLVPPPAVANAPRVMAAPAPAARALVASPDKLFQAIEAKDAAALRQALSQGASPDAKASSRTAEGNPALTQAVIQRWPEGVRILLAAGANKEAKNNKGHTAADVALELGYSDMTELLATPR